MKKELQRKNNYRLLTNGNHMFWVEYFSGYKWRAVANFRKEVMAVDYFNMVTQ